MTVFSTFTLCSIVFQFTLCSFIVKFKRERYLKSKAAYIPGDDLPKRFLKISLRGHPLCTYAKIFEKLTFLTP